MTRYFFGFICVLALAVMGCGESAGTGGSGGSAGTGGIGGEGGTGGRGVACETVDDCPEADLCTKEVDCINRLCFNTPLDCDDHFDCTVNTCDPAVGCEETAVADETPCAGGVCQAGQCALSGTVQPCTEQGIRNALAVGGGPYTFNCHGPTTAATDAAFEAKAEVILDGEGNLRVDGGYFFVRPGTSVELRGFGFDGPGSIVIQGVLTFVDSTLGHGATIEGVDKGGILAIVMNIVNSTLLGTTITVCCGDSTLIMTDSTLAGGTIHTSGTATTIINSTISNSTLDTATTMTNSIISSPDGCGAHVVSNGYNIESPGDTCGFDQPTDQVNVSAEDLKLGELADNGGPTMTHALLPGSVAIDVVPEAECEVDEDQRGEPRPGGAMCDVGAFEVQP